MESIAQSHVANGGGAQEKRRSTLNLMYGSPMRNLRLAGLAYASKCGLTYWQRVLVKSRHVVTIIKSGS